MKKKGTAYIVYPLDVPGLSEARSQVRQLEGLVGMFKVGLELFIKEGPAVVKMVRESSCAGIFLDLKLHDISETVGRAMEQVAGMGVELVTVHCASSQKMLERAVAASHGKTRVLGVTLLTDNDASTIEAAGYERKYVENPGRLVLKRAQMAHEAGCAGVVCSGHEVAAVKESLGNAFLAVTPGIRPGWTVLENDDQARVTTPAMAVEAGADFIVVGRPIRTAADPRDAARRIGEEIELALDKA